MKAVFNDKDIDAVLEFSTPETLACHWLRVWACQAGKDVYVEKPKYQNIWEEEKMGEAGEKYNRIGPGGIQNQKCALNGFSAPRLI